MVDTKYPAKWRNLVYTGGMEPPHGRLAFAAINSLDTRGLREALPSLSPDFLNTYEENEHTILNQACAFAPANMIQMLLDAGCDPNRLDTTQDSPLATACWEGRADIVRILLEAGADPDNMGPNVGGQIDQDHIQVLLEEFRSRKHAQEQAEQLDQGTASTSYIARTPRL